MTGEEALFNLNIDADAIERKVRDAVLTSALGRKIHESVDKVCQQYGGSVFDRAIDDTVKAEVQKIVREVIIQKYREKIRELVEKRVTEEVVDGFVTKAFEAFSKSLDRW